MLTRYYTLRKKIYQQEIKALISQIKQFSMLLFVVLGTALPAAFYGALLGFGIIYKTQSGAVDSLTIVWCFLLLQTLLMQLCMQAITGRQYSLYLTSLQPPVWQRRVVTALFSFYCLPLLLLNVLVIAFIDVHRWHEIPHGFLFLGLQVVLAISNFTRTKALYWFLSVSFAYTVLASSVVAFADITLTQHLLIFYGVLTVSYALAKYTIRVPIPMPLVMVIWIKHAMDNKRILSIQLGLGMLVCVMASYCAQQMPHYQSAVHFIAAQLLVLISAGFQISVTQMLEKHRLYYHAILRKNTYKLAQYSVAAITTSVLLITLSMMTIFSISIPAHALCSLLLLYCAKQRPSIFIFVWVVFSVTFGWLMLV